MNSYMKRQGFIELIDTPDIIVGVKRKLYLKMTTEHNQFTEEDFMELTQVTLFDKYLG